MNWEELYIQGIDVTSISKDSEEYQTLVSAADHGDASAQYYFGLWSEKVDKKPNVALMWFEEAAQQHFEKASEAIQRLVSEQGVMSENVTTENISGVSQQTSLVIKEHDFQAAKNSLKKYVEKTKKDVGLSRVPNDGGLFNLGSHKVTGLELNRIISQIQDYLIALNTLGQGLVDEFGEVYKAFEALDKDYISSIVGSIKAAEKVSKDEQKDRKNIKELGAKLDSFIQEQVSAIHIIENTQKEKFEELLKCQSSTLEQIANAQSSKLEQVYQSFEEEKNIFNKQVNAFARKEKFFYIIVGSVAALTVIQLLLNILGVF